MLRRLFFNLKKAGNEEFGNQYFIDKTNKRFVKCFGIPEATKVPAEWHGWLHYNQDDPPQANTSHKKFSWQKIHIPNLTGTKLAYIPKNLSNKKTNSFYEPWQPEL